MPAASCPDCTWEQDYTQAGNARRGLDRHLETCGQPDPTDLRWTTRTDAAGYPLERTVDEWMAHPFALDDLARVLAGTPLGVIDGERREYRRLTA